MRLFEGLAQLARIKGENIARSMVAEEIKLVLDGLAVEYAIEDKRFERRHVRVRDRLLYDDEGVIIGHVGLQK